MEKLYHPMTAADPHAKRRILMQGYKQIFKGIRYKGKLYDVVVHIKKEDLFSWDGMSIPKMAQRWVGNPFSPKHELAGMVHDWLYFIQVYPKGVCDLVMLRILEADGESRFKRAVMHRAVKWGGGGAWKSHKKKIKSRCECQINNEDIVDDARYKCIIHRTEIFVFIHKDGSIRARMEE